MRKPSSARRRPPGRRPPRRPWSLLVYIGGDNDLSDAGLEDLDEMGVEGSSPDLHVGVEIDTYGEHTGSIRYEITPADFPGEAHRTVLERLPERDTGDPATFTAFARWGLGRFPARKTILVAWNHGSGFRRPRRDIAFDDFGTSLSMPAMDEALRRAGLRPGRRLSILGFDACLMNMVEVAHEFAGRAEILVGSQQTEPGDGWPYDRVLARAKGDPAPADLARAIVTEYIADYRRRGMPGVTQSAVDLSRTAPVVDRLHDLGATLLGLLPLHAPAIRRARAEAQVYEYADYVDLVDLAERLSEALPSPEASSASAALIASVRSAVIATESYGTSVKRSHGLSGWWPPRPDQYFDARAKYLSLASNRRRTDWIRFLDALHR